MSEFSFDFSAHSPASQLGHLRFESDRLIKKHRIFRISLMSNDRHWLVRSVWLFYSLVASTGRSLLRPEFLSFKRRSRSQSWPSKIFLFFAETFLRSIWPICRIVFRWNNWAIFQKFVSFEICSFWFAVKSTKKRHFQTLFENYLDLPVSYWKGVIQ